MANVKNGVFRESIIDRCLHSRREYSTLGVSHNLNEGVTMIEIWIDKDHLPYTLSKPIHKTQRIAEKRSDGSAVITIQVVPNYELEQLLLPYVDHIEILSPKSFRDKIKARIKNNFEKYK